VKLVVIAVLALVACDKLPKRPDETKFKAMDAWERCRATASRAIMCTNELMVAEMRSAISGDNSLDGFTDDVAKQLETEPGKSPKAERKANLEIHKTTCRGDRETGYVDGIFRCWAIEDCKKFAACVYERPAAPSNPNAEQPNVEQPNAEQPNAERPPKPAAPAQP